MAIHVLDGSTFFVFDEVGDAHGIETDGLFFRDTRFLSVCRLRLNGQPLSSLSYEHTSYYAVRFFLTPPATVYERRMSRSSGSARSATACTRTSRC